MVLRNPPHLSTCYFLHSAVSNDAFDRVPRHRHALLDLNKYMLLRINKIPEQSGEDLAVGLTVFLPLIPAIYAASNYYFLNELSDGSRTYSLFVMAFTVLYYFLPKEVLMRK